MSSNGTLTEREQLKIEFYRTYDLMTGVRIAATLGGFFGLIILLLVYKSRCKSSKQLADPRLTAAAAAAVAAAEAEERALAAALEAIARAPRRPAAGPRRSLCVEPLESRTARFSSLAGYEVLVSAKRQNLPYQLHQPQRPQQRHQTRHQPVLLRQYDHQPSYQQQQQCEQQYEQQQQLQYEQQQQLLLQYDQRNSGQVTQCKQQKSLQQGLKQQKSLQQGEQCHNQDVQGVQRKSGYVQSEQRYNQDVHCLQRYNQDVQGEQRHNQHVQSEQRHNEHLQSQQQLLFEYQQRRCSSVTCSSTGSGYLERRGSAMPVPWLAMHSGNTWEGSYPIDIQVIQPTPNLTPCTSHAHLPPGRAPLVSMVSMDPPEPDSRSQGSDSVFLRCEEEHLDTEDEVSGFSTDSETIGNGGRFLRVPGRGRVRGVERRRRGCEDVEVTRCEAVHLSNSNSNSASSSNSNSSEDSCSPVIELRHRPGSQAPPFWSQETLF